MRSRSCPQASFPKVALPALCAFTLATMGCSSSGSGGSGAETGTSTNDGGGSPGSGSTSSGTDQFSVTAGPQSYTYDCAEQSLDQTAGPRIVSTGCNWPTTNPRVEVDFAVQGSQALENVTIELGSQAATSSILFTVGLADQSNLDAVSIYASFATGGSAVAAGTSGTVTVKSYDPSSGHMDVIATNVVLPVSTDFDLYPGAPSTVTVQSAEIIR